MKLEDFDPNAGLKKCPYCAETIQAAAIVCKHCGRNISPQPVQYAKPIANNQSTAEIIGRISSNIFIIGLLIIFLGCVLALILGYH